MLSLSVTIHVSCIRLRLFLFLFSTIIIITMFFIDKSQALTTMFSLWQVLSKFLLNGCVCWIESWSILSYMTAVLSDHPAAYRMALPLFRNKWAQPFNYVSTAWRPRELENNYDEFPGEYSNTNRWKLEETPTKQHINTLVKDKVACLVVFYSGLVNSWVSFVTCQEHWVGVWVGAWDV